MKTNKQNNGFSAKLAAYAAVAAGLAASNAANANVQYMVVDPDMDISANYALDLDGDMVTDFTFAAGTAGPVTTYTAASALQNSGYWWRGNTFIFSFNASVQPALGNGVVGGSTNVSTLTTGSYVTASMPKAATFIGYQSTSYYTGSWAYNVLVGTGTTAIDAPGSWYNSGTTGGGPGSSSGAIGKTAYIGLAFQISGQTHYGWARIMIGTAADPTLTLIDYAYEDQANTAIRVGEMAVGVKKQDESKVNVYSFNKGIHINNATKGASVQVYDLSGKQVYSSTAKGTATKVDMSGHQGTYVVRVNNTSRKVYIN